MRNRPRHASHGRERYLRSHATFAEQRLWSAMRHLKTFKFRRQHRIENLIVDFYCTEVRLAVEIDGSIHESNILNLSDGERDARLRSLGVRVIHFKNWEVERNINDVVKRIEDVCCFF